jgi:hypothetical protein
MKLNDVVNAVGSLKILIEKPMKAKTSFKLSMLIDAIEVPNKLFEEKKLELFKKYGEDKDGQLSVPSAKVPEFQAELEDLLNTEVSVDERISLSDIEDIEVEARVIYLMKPFITKD